MNNNVQFEYLWEPWGGLSETLFENMDMFDKLLKSREADAVGLSGHLSGVSLLHDAEIDLYHQLKEVMVADTFQHYLEKGISTRSDIEKHNRLVCIASRLTGIRRPELRTLHLEQLSELVNTYKNEAA